MKTLAILALALTFTVAGCNKHEPKHPGSVVKVLVDGGHGSAVHIGNGYMLTAAHVVEDAKEVKFKADDGSEGTAEVMWVAKAYDVAMLHTTTKLEASHISCAQLKVGTPVEARGNPADQEFISTWGKVGGSTTGESPWKASIVVSMTIVPGMSGGALLDDYGRLVGVVVGVMAKQTPFSSSLMGIGYVVPTYAICGMLGR